jgi:protein phosphatase
VLGAAAERAIPPLGSRTPAGRLSDGEDTVITSRVRRAGADDPANDDDEPAMQRIDDDDEPAMQRIDDEDEARYNPQPPARRHLARPLAALLVIALVLGGSLVAAYSWTRSQYFVGSAGAQVAIYRGLSDRIPGLHLSKVFEVQDLTVAELPPYYQDKVNAKIDVSSLESARQTVAELREAAKRCAAQKPPGQPSTGPTKPSTKPTQTSSPPTVANVTPGPTPTSTSGQPSC